MDNTALALQNQAAINAQFAQGLAPLNNYAAQNLQLGIAQQRAEQERAQRIYEMQLQQQFAKEREAAQYDYNRRLAAQAEAASFETNKYIQTSTAKREQDQARLTFALQDEKEKSKEANALRENPDVKHILGTDVNNFKDTPEGNAALIAYWHTKTARPEVQEELNTSKVENWAKQARQVINSMTSIAPGSEEGRKAVMAFLQQPGVVQLLTKKGDLTTDDVNRIMNGGDPSKVIAAIKQVGDNSFWSLTGETREAQLMTAWSTALSQAQGQPSGSGITKMNFLQNMLKNIDTVMPNLTSESSLSRVSKALGVTMDTPKTPPPPKTGVQALPTAQAGSPNPFGEPNTKIDQPSVGLAGLMQQNPLQSANANALQMASAFQQAAPQDRHENLLRAAFVPKRLAADPATEYAVRQQLLDSARKTSAAQAGMEEGFLFQKPQPYYDAFKQTQDEQKLQGLVKGLYSPQPQQYPIINLQQGIPNILGP